MKYVFSVFFLAILSIKGNAQNTNHFYIGMSPTFQNTKEARFTSTFRNGTGYSAVIGYANANRKRAHNFTIEFTSAKQGASNISYTRNLKPVINYQYLFLKKRQIALGAEIQIGSLLEFRSGLAPSTNQISYLIWNSIGISVNKSFYINTPKIKFPLALFSSMPIISYVVRPSYSFPFPDRFLEQENFNFDLDNLGSNIIKGGKLKTLNSYINLNLGLQAYKIFDNSNFGVSVKYQFNYLSYLKEKTLFQFSHHIYFVIHLKSSK